MHAAETVLVVCALLALAVAAAGLGRRLPVPHTVLLLLLGMALGALARHAGVFAPLLHLRLTPELVLFGLLPALVFESAFNLSARQLLKDLAPIMMLAIPALFVSTAVIALGLWALLGVPLAVALLFGALISATDPVAVVALFKELGTPLRLNVLVEGESLLNDATAIVLFKILLAAAMTGAIAGAPGWSQLGRGAGDFLLVFFGGAAIGAALGAAASELVHRLKSDATAMTLMTFVVAYAGFALAESLHVSGVMAVACAALAFAALSVTRASQAQMADVREVWEVAAMTCNALLFLLMGLTIDPLALAADAGAIAVAVALMLLGRALPVYALLPATTRAFRLPRVSRGEQHIMWWGGLRGGLAIAIALSIPEDLPGRVLIQHLALGAVLFTLLVNAPSIRPVIRRLGIDRMSDEERAEVREGLEQGRHAAEATLARYRALSLLRPAAGWRVRRRLHAVFEENLPEVSARERLQHVRLRAIRAEFDALSTLHEQGVIQSYVFLDLRAILQRDREAPRAGTSEAPRAGTSEAPRAGTSEAPRAGSSEAPRAGTSESPAQDARPNPLLRLELMLVRRLRERDWAAGLLARYQNVRVDQRLQRDIAGVVIARAALESLEGDAELPQGEREALAAPYRARLERRLRRIEEIRADFPDYARDHDVRLWLRVALLGARARNEDARHHGELGAKAHAWIERRIADALAALPGAVRATPQPRELIAGVPLFAGLPQAALERIAARARTVSFLPGDVVIGEGDTGDALYVVAHGRLLASRRAAGGGEAGLGALGEGEFFGESGLLGDHLRTATVRARTPCTLLRLARAEVLALAEGEPEILSRLEAARGARAAAGAPDHSSA